MTLPKPRSVLVFLKLSLKIAWTVCEWELQRKGQRSHEIMWHYEIMWHHVRSCDMWDQVIPQDHVTSHEIRWHHMISCDITTSQYKQVLCSLMPWLSPPTNEILRASSRKLDGRQLDMSWQQSWMGAENRASCYGSLSSLSTTDHYQRTNNLDLD